MWFGSFANQINDVRDDFFVCFRLFVFSACTCCPLYFYFYLILIFSSFLFFVVVPGENKQTNKQQIGRLRRNKPPRAYSSSGGMKGGGGGSFNANVAAGRLLCDTYLSAKEFLRETTYRCAAFFFLGLALVGHALNTEVFFTAL